MTIGKDVSIRYTATDGTGPASRGVVNNLRMVNRETQMVQQVSRSWNRGLSENRRAVQQLGFQLTDFSVQIAGGQNAMLAFVQQGGQMLQVFGPAGAIMATLLTVFGTLAIVAAKTGFAFSDLAGAFGLMSSDVQLIAGAFGFLKETMISAANLIINNVFAILAAAALVATYFIGPWVRSLVVAMLPLNAMRALVLTTAMAFQMGGLSAAAMTLSTNLLTGALTLLRAVFMTLLPVAVVVAIAWLIQAFVRVSAGAGSIGKTLGLLQDVAVGVFKGVRNSAKAAFNAIAGGVSWMAARFVGAFQIIGDAWDAVANGMAAGWNMIAESSIGAKAGMTAMGKSGVGQMISGYAADLDASSARFFRTARRLWNADTGTAAALAKLSEAYRKGTETTDIRNLGGAGAGSGGGGAAGEAKKQADEIKRIFDQMQSSISDSIMGSFKALLQGTKSIGDAARDILSSIIDNVIDLLMTPIFNGVAKSIVGGITGGLGGMGAKIPSFAGGGGTGSGVRAGGLDGKGGFMAMLHPNERVVDNTTRNGSDSAAPVIINMHITTPDAESFRASSRQIAAKLREAM